MNELDLLALNENIEKAFKSLMKSGRPDIYDGENNSLMSEIYVDLFENNYALRQAKDDNHTILSGRRGTGKSTIFLKAIEDLKTTHSTICCYINLQTCFENSNTLEQDVDSGKLSRILTYKNFFNHIINSILENIYLTNLETEDQLKELQKEISEGKYITRDFQKTIEFASEINVTQKNKLNIGFDKAINFSTGLENGNDKKVTEKSNSSEIRIYSINDILNQIVKILSKKNVNKFYLFLDDFSELSLNAQKIVVDNLISPIVSSYNKNFIIKIAAYPHRIYYGNIDTTKIQTYQLDYYNAFEQNAKNYNDIENNATDYIKRTLQKRVMIFTNDQITFEELFDTQKNDLNFYLKQLFYITSAIPRTLGYILNYALISTINAGKKITSDDLESASVKYFENNIYPDFINDIRFKQSFYDEMEILNQLAQKHLIDNVKNKQIETRNNIINNFINNGNIKQIYDETLKKYKKGNIYWLPTSHFYVEKKIEKMLNTLELYFMISKFYEGSSRDRGNKVCFYGLNYGFCSINKIDYGRPELRRTYDYWRQDEFNFTELIPTILSNVEQISCVHCGEEYSEDNYIVYQKHKNCFKCGNHETVKKYNKLQNKIKSKIEEWSGKKIKDNYMEILRILYNSKKELSAYEIGIEIEKHHLTISKYMTYLKDQNYVDYKEDGRRYYKISDKAINTFFKADIDSELN